MGWGPREDACTTCVGCVAPCSCTVPRSQWLSLHALHHTGRHGQRGTAGGSRATGGHADDVCRLRSTVLAHHASQSIAVPMHVPAIVSIGWQAAGCHWQLRDAALSAREQRSAVGGRPCTCSSVSTGVGSTTTWGVTRGTTYDIHQLRGTMLVHRAL